MKLLNYTQFLNEDNHILFTGQGNVDNTSTKDNIFTPGQNMSVKKKIKGKKVKLPLSSVTQPPLTIAKSYVNRLLQ